MMGIYLSQQQIELIKQTVRAGAFTDLNPRDRKRCISLNAAGLLTRDKKESNIWYPTEKAMAEYQPQLTEPAAQAQNVAVVAAAEIEPAHDASGLVETVERARALLDDGDVIRARIVAAGAFAQAKTEADFAKKFGATEALVMKSRRLQADALLIETRAKMIISGQWDAAQAAGLVSKGGRPKPVSDGNGLTAEDTGLSRKEIHGARKLADAERAAPGLVERAIEARIAAGLEPTRSSLRAAIGTRTATAEERGHNLYETPPEAMATLLALEDFSSAVLDPSCGRGASGKPLEAAGYTVLFADLVDYGTADQHGELQRVEDFLDSAAYDGNPDIVTNPPYGALLNRFVAHALRVHRPRKMALLLNVNFYGGTENDDRNFALDENGPARIYWFARRLPMMHRDGWEGKEASSQMNTAWFVWELQEDGSYGARTEIRRVDWKEHVEVEGPAESEAA